MKVAVLSDVHGNVPALRTVMADIDGWSPDLVVVDGDIVNRGPVSDECLEILLERRDRQGWHLLRGNHEEFVMDCGQPERPRAGPPYEMAQFAHFALAQVSQYIHEIATLPDIYERPGPDGALLRIVHASMRNNRDGIYPMTTDDDLRRQIAPAPAVFVTGHTHRSLVRQIDETLVVNIGSVGLSFDDDRRAGYGRFTWDGERWQAEIIRLAYDYNLLEADYVRSGFLARGGPLAQLMLVEYRKARGLVHRWASRYEEAVLSGRMTLEESVRQILCDEDVRPFTGPPGWTV